MLAKSALVGQLSQPAAKLSEYKRAVSWGPFQKKKLRKTGASPFRSTQKPWFQHAQGLLWLVMSLRRLADQALKWLQRLLGKPVVKFADLLRLGH